MMNVSMPTVSIIVPVYNVEKYLSRCLDSILSQTYGNICEIICIDDGSTDGSYKILKQYEKIDSRIIVLLQENCGPAFTRRRGVSLATGDYIGFVDSDDWVDPKMYQLLVEEAEKRNCDLVVCDFYKSSVGILKHEKGYRGKNLSVEEFMLSHTPPYLPLKLFRKDLKPYMLNSVGENQAEDVGLLYPVLVHVKRIGYVPEPLYYYFQRADSSSNSDSFVQNYSIDEYFRTLSELIAYDYSKYNAFALKHFVQMLYYGIKSPARSCFLAEYIEFMQSISHLLIGREEIKEFKDIGQYLFHKTIPAKFIVFEHEKNEASLNVKDSWSQFAPHCEVVTISREIEEDFPPVVRDAWLYSDFNFVQDFLKLKYIYENGGIAISEKVKLNKPIGELREKSVFVGYAEERNINTAFWGAVERHPLIESVLNSYYEDTLINSTEIGLEKRFYFALCRKYSLTQADLNEHSLADGVRVYRCDKLTFNANRNNVAQIYTSLHYDAAENGMTVLPKEVIIQLINQAHLDGRKSANRVGEQTNFSGAEIEYYKNEVLRLKNSRSWKITRPLRKFFNYFRKVKYSAKEIE